MTSNAFSWIVSIIMRIAGYEYSLVDNSCRLKQSDLYVDFTTVKEEDKEKFYIGELAPRHVRFHNGRIIPIWGSDEFGHWKGNRFIVCADVISVSYMLLTLSYEETSKKDAIGRSLYKGSLLEKYGIGQTPIIDEYAMEIRHNLAEKKVKNRKKLPSVILTHDIDNIWRFRGIANSLKSIIGGDVIRDRDVVRGLNSFWQLLKGKGKLENDPYYKACDELLTVERSFGFLPLFFFLGYNKNNNDWRYEVSDDNIKSLMIRLRHYGGIIGFHGGINTVDNEREFRIQLNNVKKVHGEAIIHARQHYLQFRPGVTNIIWRNNDIIHDYTLGFFDCVGFKCGTSHAFNLFDIDSDCIMDVVEHPLNIMDVSLFSYMGCDDNKALELSVEMLERVISVEGDLVVLWHNDSLCRKMKKHYLNFYLPFLEMCKKKMSRGDN